MGRHADLLDILALGILGIVTLGLCLGIGYRLDRLETLIEERLPPPQQDNTASPGSSSRTSLPPTPGDPVSGQRRHADPVRTPAGALARRAALLTPGSGPNEPCRPGRRGLRTQAVPVAWTRPSRADGEPEFGLHTSVAGALNRHRFLYRFFEGRTRLNLPYLTSLASAEPGSASAIIIGVGPNCNPLFPA